MRTTQLLVDLKNINHNIFEIKKYLGSDIDIMPIVKSFAYGTHLNECPDILNNFNIVGVAYLDEAIKLRENGYKNQILILYPLSSAEYNIARNYNFILNGSNIFEIMNFSDNTRIDLEIETGMGRTGLPIDKLDDYIKKLKSHKNIIVDGVFTHLSTATDNEFSLKQINLFEKAIKMLSENNINPKRLHLSSSGGLNFYKDKLYNMVRIGILIYGYYPNESLKEVLKLKPSLVLKTNISFLKILNPGDTVGYNKNFVAKECRKVATIPFGFADGLLTLETGEPFVLVNGEKAKIIGICMDNMMIDVTDIPNVKLGQEVYIWDNYNLTIEQIGKWCNGICNYEVMSSISERVPRILRR